jgi:glycosidase
MEMDEFIFGTLSTTDQRVAKLEREQKGVRHEPLLKPLAPGARDSPQLTVTVELDQTIEGINCVLLEPEKLIIPFYRASTDWDLLNWSYYQRWQVKLPARPEGTVVRYNIEARPAGGEGPIPADDGATFSYLVGDPSPPKWVAGAIIYQIFPDRFHPGLGQDWIQSSDLEKAYGGTFRGIIDHLDYISGLGFNCIWLNPFFPDDTYHGYHATDYFSVNPRLGSEEELKELVEVAHSRDIRLLLDFVANHWGSQHPTFQAALAERESEFHDWYKWRNWPTDYETFFGVKDLPQINVDHPPARAHLLEAAEYWLTEFDFDGLRLDYSLGPSIDFWTDFGAAVRRAKPEAWIFGEAVDTPTSQLRYWGRLHGCLDFLLEEALRRTFALGTMNLGLFDAFLEKHEAFFPADFSRPSFLDNHDVNRFLWLAGGEKRKLKLAALCQFTLSGPPIIYYGTEASLTQEQGVVHPNGRHRLAEARLPMVWGEDQDQELLEYYRWLIHFRREHPVLWHGRRRTLYLDVEASIYVYAREDEVETIVVALNLSDRQRQFNVDGEAYTLSPWGSEVSVLPTTKLL